MSSWVIYDGGCGFCGRYVQWLRRLDWSGKFRMLAYQDPRLGEWLPKLDPKSCEESIHLVTEQGQVLRGADAIRSILRHLPLTALPAWFLGIPPLPQLLRWLYPLLARNRHRIAACPTELTMRETFNP